MWAWHNSADANSVLSKHSGKGVSSSKHNLIMEAMSAGIHPSATAMTSSVTRTPTAEPPLTGDNGSGCGRVILDYNSR